MTIRAIYAEDPGFPATDQHPDAVRYVVGQWIVDAIGPAPTQADLDAVFNPPDPPRIAGLKSDAGVQTLLAQAKGATVAQIDAWLTANVTTLPQARAVLAAIIKVLALQQG